MIALVLVLMLELGLATISTRNLRRPDLLVLFVLLLLIAPVELGPPHLVLAGLIGYAASVVWRLGRALIRRIPPLRTWLFRRGYKRMFARLPASPVVIAAATSLVLILPSGVALLGLAALVVATARISPEWRRDRFGPPTAQMSIAASANVLGLAALLAVASGRAEWASPESSEHLLPQLVGVQITLGLLPLTVLTFATQLVAASAGAGAASVLPWPRVSGAILVVLGSIAYDLFLLGSEVQSGDLEWAQLVALVAVSLSLLTAAGVTYYLQPQRVAGDLVRRLDGNWLGDLSRSYGEPHQPWLGADPFRDVERLLYIAATRESDIRLFNATLRDVIERIGELVPRRATGDHPRAELALDEYLAGALSALIAETSRERRGWVLESLIWFREELSDRAVEHAGHDGPLPPGRWIERTRYSVPPSGLQLLGRVVEAAIENGLEDEGRLAVARVGRYVDAHLPRLPDPTGVYDIDPDAEVRFDADAPAQQAADGVEAVLAVFQRWADEAVRAGRTAIAEAAAFQVSQVCGGAHDQPDPRWARWLSSQATSTAYAIALTGVRRGQLLYDIPYGMKRLDPANPVHVSAAQGMAFWTPFTVATCGPVADYMLIINATMLALSLVNGFLPQAAAIAAALERVREVQSQLPASPDRFVVLREIDKRLTQLREAARKRETEYDSERVAFATRIARELGDASGQEERTGEVS